MVSPDGLAQLQKDVEALTSEANRVTGENLDDVWAEIRQVRKRGSIAAELCVTCELTLRWAPPLVWQTIAVPLNDAVTEYVQPATRQQNFREARPAKV